MYFTETKPCFILKKLLLDIALLDITITAFLKFDPKTSDFMQGNLTIIGWEKKHKPLQTCLCTSHQISFSLDDWYGMFLNWSRFAISCKLIIDSIMKKMSCVSKAIKHLKQIAKKQKSHDQNMPKLPAVFHQGSISSIFVIKILEL